MIIAYDGSKDVEIRVFVSNFPTTIARNLHKFPLRKHPNNNFGLILRLILLQTKCSVLVTKSGVFFI